MSPTAKNELDVRLSVVETKVSGIEEDSSENKEVLRDIATKVDGLKERFDKMNGSVPFIKETVSRIEKHLETVIVANNKQETQIARNSMYVKLLWGIMTPVVLMVIGSMVKIVFLN